MKQINQIIHLTNSKEVLKSILKNGFYTSYANEIFGKESILIPMISFSNILFRDIGESEVVNYGSYGIVFERDYAIEQFDLNPVIYVKNQSEMSDVFSYNFETSIIPQVLHVAKKFSIDSKGETFSNHISIKPISDEVKNLLDTVDENVNDDFLLSIQKIFENYYVNTLKQVLLLKAFKVENKVGELKIAYNEREWRKSFFDLNHIRQFKPNGTLNEEYEMIINKQKPHFTVDNVLPIEVGNIKYVYVETDSEVEEMQHFIRENFDVPVQVSTLLELQKSEN
ncbi:abortive infection system antitoxin AbiGi family protein [Kaistella antarctica]|uniref:abortive infection system antitoxin AbiGi family protein n=1 Tax=Kaistella antarctica TaxID=266748 RepID=UPI000F840472|nr:abortive infection system antitoxin AbiGi family protein [Kaistella antarctica]